MSKKFRISQMELTSSANNRSGIKTTNMTASTPDHVVGTSRKNVQVDENGEFVVGTIPNYSALGDAVGSVATPITVNTPIEINPDVTVRKINTDGTKILIPADIYPQKINKYEDIFGAQVLLTTPTLTGWGIGNKDLYIIPISPVINVPAIPYAAPAGTEWRISGTTRAGVSIFQSNGTIDIGLSADNNDQAGFQSITVTAGQNKSFGWVSGTFDIGYKATLNPTFYITTEQGTQPYNIGGSFNYEYVESTYRLYLSLI